MKMVENPAAGLSAAQLRELVELLIARRRELVAALDELNHQIARRQDCSVADAAEAAAIREEALRAQGIAGSHSDTIAAIDLALRRIETGHYGVCEDSGKAIGFERLALVPWASRVAPDRT